MAKRTQPLLVTGVALASAAAIITATPEVLPTSTTASIASSTPTPLRISHAKYELTALTDITLQGINDAYWFGWGGFVGGGFDPDVVYAATTPGVPPYVSDPYYPDVNGAVAVDYNEDGEATDYVYNQSPIYLSGVSGVLYYLVDVATEASNLILDNYYFEIGPSSLPYVASAQIFGTDSPIFLAAQALFYYGVPNVINSLILSTAAALPTFNIGPVKVGGGILASLYYNSYTPDYNAITGTGFKYDTNGLSAVLSYIVTSISDALPSAAATSAAAKTAEVAALSAAPSDASDASDAGETKAEETTTEAETATEAAPKATGGFKKETEATASSASSATETASAAETESSTEDATDGASAEGPAEGTTADTTPKATPVAKPAKPENPLSKIGKKISDALSGKKADKSDAGSSSDSGSGGSRSTGGSAKS